MKSVLIPAMLLFGMEAALSGAIAPAVHPFFVANHGEAPDNIRFLSHTEAMTAHFADQSVDVGTSRSRVQAEFVGASSLSRVDRAGNSLVYRGTWPGIEIRYSPHEGTVKSEYQVDAGADPDRIRVRYRGAGMPKILGDGSLYIGLSGAEFVESPPYAYQERNGRVDVPVEYRIGDDGTVGFALGEYDPSLPLIIDPVMNYSTLFGGSGDTSVTSVAVDAYGNAVVAGWTTARDLAARGARTKSGGGVDAFVAKLSAQGNQVVWCNYLGGTGDDRAFGVAVDASGNVYVTGWTQSTNFPVVGALQPRLWGSRSAFVTKLNSTGTSIVYSTYLGGNNRDQGNAIAVDSTGAAYITGDVTSTNFPVINPYQATLAGQQDAFVAKLSPAGNALAFSTYIGGFAADHSAAIALDSSRNVYITGSTYSPNFPVVAPTQAKIGGGQDAFVAELNASGNGLLFATFLGGSGGTVGLGETGNAIAVDSAGNVYVGGATSSFDFPTTSGAYQRTLTNGGAEDHGFAWKMNNSRQLVYSTYLAGMNVDVVNGLAVDPAGNAYLAGSTSSADFPIVRPFQATIVGQTSAFLLKLNPSGSGLIFGSFLGGSFSDVANGLAVDAKQNIVVGGLTQSADFPLLNPAQSYSNGPSGGFVTRIVSGWYPILFNNGFWNFDVWHDAGNDGSSWTLSSTWYGQTGDLPVVGDWNHSGTTKIGVFRNGQWILDSNGNGQYDASDRVFNFGQAGDIPVVGDWDGTGTVKAGLFRRGQFILDLSGHLSGVATGKQDLTFSFGNWTDLPVVGDWGSTGVTKVGVFRDGTWFLDINGDRVFGPGDQSFGYGASGDTPLVGDWDGSGTPKIGSCRAGTWMFNITGDNIYKPGVDTQFAFGGSTVMYLIGH